MLLFLDGVGLGEPDPTLNPLSAAATPVLERLVGGPLVRTATPTTGDRIVFRKLDATLGEEGLPQSATGQTAILTGVNGAAAMNRHYGPWPGPTLKRILDRGTLFSRAKAIGGAALANAYPPGYFEAMTSRRYRPNANVYAATAANVELRGAAEYRAGLGAPSDLEGAHLIASSTGERGVGPEGSARAVARLARAHTFTMLDVWLTDRFGHQRDLEAGKAILERFDSFLGALIEGEESVVDAGGTVVITSDHGNLEDLSSSSHTLNEVPLLAVGQGAEAFREARSLLDVAPAMGAIIDLA